MSAGDFAKLGLIENAQRINLNPFEEAKSGWMIIVKLNELDGGELSYPNVSAALNRLGYACYVGCKDKPVGKAEDVLIWLKATVV